jgi:hypothetical protein
MQQHTIFALASCLLFLSHDLSAGKHEVKETIQQGADLFKKGVDKCGDKVDDLKEYVRTYNYKELIQERAVSGPATITHVEFNDYPLAVVARPGERIDGKLHYYLDKDQCKDLKYHRLLIGIHEDGPQTAVGIGLGYLADQENKERFTLHAPKQPGVYQVRFRSVENFTEGEAKKHWLDAEGQAPSAMQTIGVIVVKE